MEFLPAIELGCSWAQALPGDAGSAACQAMDVLLQHGGQDAASCLMAVGAAEALVQAALQPLHLSSSCRYALEIPYIPVFWPACLLILLLLPI